MNGVAFLWFPKVVLGVFQSFRRTLGCSKEIRCTLPQHSLKGRMAESTLAPSDSTLGLGQSKSTKDNLLAFINKLLGCHLGVIQQFRRVLAGVILL